MPKQAMVHKLPIAFYGEHMYATYNPEAQMTEE